MKATTRIGSISALALASLAFAQPSETKLHNGGAVDRPAANAGRGVDPKAGQVIDIEFSGGLLSDFVSLMVKATDPKINLAVAPEILKAKIPALSLRKITVPNALLAAITAAEDPAKFFWTLESGDGLNPLYRISSRNGPQSAAARGEPSLQVFPLKDWAATPDITLSAVESAVSLLGGDEPPRVSYHKDSGLLMVSGTPANIDTVKKVLDGLEQRANAAREQLDRNIAINVINTIKAPSEKQALDLITVWKGKAEDYDRLMADNAMSRAMSQEKIDIIRREVEEVRKRAADQVNALDKELILWKTANSNVQNLLNAEKAENQRLKAELENLRAMAAKAAAQSAPPK